MIQALLDGRTADHCMGIPYFLGFSGGSRDDLLRALMFEDSGNLAGMEFKHGDWVNVHVGLGPSI